MRLAVSRETPSDPDKYEMSGFLLKKLLQVEINKSLEEIMTEKTHIL